MECYVHPGEPAVGACVACGHLVCDVCRVEMEGRIYCKACLAQPARRSHGGDGGPFRRSRREKVVAGVCGGIAQMWKLDVSLVRILYVLAWFMTGFFPMTIVYFVVWAAVPEED
jgi:phage shock protein PspC (stress-responsive transcriptional regulator)